MTLGFMQALYSKVFIGINIDSDICYLNIIRIKNDTIKQNIKTEARIFNETFPADAYRLIHFYQKKYPFTYIGMMSKTTAQGAIPTADPQQFIQYDISPSQVQVIPFASWCAHIQKEECLRLSQKIPEIGTLDYLFSPFVLILTKARSNPKLAIYAILEQDSFSIAICDNKQMHYGKTFFHNKHSLKINANEEAILNLDHLLQSIDEDIQGIRSLELDPQQISDQKDEQKIDELNDFVRATLISESLGQAIHEYYQNNSSFVDEIVLLDTYGISSDALQYIQDALLLETKIHPFSIPSELTALMSRDFKKGNR